MLVFLSAMDTSDEKEVKYILEHCNYKMYYNLMSYFYLTKKPNVYRLVRDYSEKLLIDSGAHSFQKGKKVNWKEYTKEYASWIRQNDSNKILGFFEMDIDPAGYSYTMVKELRKILTSQSDKIIPVWHKGRGIEDFYDMCDNPIHRDRIVAVTGFKNQDIRDEDYNKYVSYAHSRGCKVHCLGMTRTSVMDKVPFDFVDSSSWKMSCIFGKYGDYVLPKHIKANGNKRYEMMCKNYLLGRKMQEIYYTKWNRYLTSIRKGGVKFEY